MSIETWLMITIITLLLMGIYGALRFYKIIKNQKSRSLTRDEVADIARSIAEHEKAKNRKN